MIKTLTHRKATVDDLTSIVSLLVEDDLGQTRESNSDQLDTRYIEAFQRINSDPNQYLMVVENCDEIVGTCHLTMLPSLTFIGSTRMQIEAVRVSPKYRGQKIGQWMMQEAIRYANSKGALIVQLTTNKQRTLAKRFYENIGFKASHKGMKLHLEQSL